MPNDPTYGHPVSGTCGTVHAGRTMIEWHDLSFGQPPERHRFGIRERYYRGGRGGRGGRGQCDGAGKRYFGRGDFKYALLELLANEPMHGYQMMKALEERSGGLYVPSPGSIYPTLQMLEDRDLVIMKQDNDKKVYHITEKGLAFLNERPDSERVGDWRDAPSEPFRPPQERHCKATAERADWIRFISRAEREASRNPELWNRFQRWMNKMLEELDELMNEGGSPEGDGKNSGSGGESRRTPPSGHHEQP